MAVKQKRLMTLWMSFVAVACTAENVGITPLVYSTNTYATHVGFLANNDIKEASGIAASRIRSDVLWAINDSGNKPYLYAFALDGADLGRVRVNNARNQDWEDLASFRFKGRAYLLVADVGDNRSLRDTSTLYIIEEPPLKGVRLAKNSAVAPAWRITFQYEDGPRDCESVAVDAANQRILLINKRTVPAVLYSLPLYSADNTFVHTARRMVEVPNIRLAPGEDTQSISLLDPYPNMPTAMDISPNETMAAILTYRYVYLFTRDPEESWAAAFSGLPKILPLPRLHQAEALCFGGDGRSIYITSEKRPAPLLRVDTGEKR